VIARGRLGFCGPSAIEMPEQAALDAGRVCGRGDLQLGSSVGRRQIQRLDDLAQLLVVHILDRAPEGEGGLRQSADASPGAVGFHGGHELGTATPSRLAGGVGNDERQVDAEHDAWAETWILADSLLHLALGVDHDELGHVEKVSSDQDESVLGPHGWQTVLKDGRRTQAR